MTGLDNIFSMEFENEYPESVRVIMPKFKIHSEMEATDLLRKTGLTQIFKGKQKWSDLTLSD